MSYEYRQAVKSDFPELFKLHSLASQRERPYAHYRWKYYLNPRGGSLAWVAIHEDSGIIAAAYLLFPWLFKVADKVVLGAQSGDTMTHPEHRRRGLFVDLCKLVLSEAGQLGFEFCMGFPNEQSLPGFKKIGWTTPGSVLRYVKHLKEPVPISGFDFEDVKYFSEDYFELWQEVSQHFRIGVVRDPAYLRWKYLDIPPKHYRIIAARQSERLMAYGVLKREAQTGIIHDLFAPPDKTADALLGVLESICIKDGLNMCEINPLEGSMLIPSLERRGFQLQGIVGEFIVHKNRPMYVSDDIFEARRWFVTLGDQDTY